MVTSRLQTLLEFLKEDPFDVFTIYAIALEYSKTDANMALEYFGMLLNTHPDYLGTYYQVGRLLRTQGKEDEAEKIYRSGIEKAIFAGDTHTKAELSNALSNMLLGLDEE